MIAKWLAHVQMHSNKSNTPDLTDRYRSDRPKFYRPAFFMNWNIFIRDIQLYRVEALSWLPDFEPWDLCCSNFHSLWSKSCSNTSSQVHFRIDARPYFYQFPHFAHDLFVNQQAFLPCMLTKCFCISLWELQEYRIPQVTYSTGMSSHTSVDGRLQNSKFQIPVVVKASTWQVHVGGIAVKGT